MLVAGTARRARAAMTTMLRMRVIWTPWGWVFDPTGGVSGQGEPAPRSPRGGPDHPPLRLRRDGRDLQRDLRRAGRPGRPADHGRDGLDALVARRVLPAARGHRALRHPLRQ